MRFPRFSLFLILLLTACGFRPLYGTGDGPAIERQLPAVSIDNIPDEAGQQLRLRLFDRFYGAGAPVTPPLYRLRVTFSTAREDLGIQSTDEATRARLTLSGAYALSDAGTGAVLLAGQERAFVGYNILRGPFATISAERDALSRGMTQLADLITNRTAVFLKGRTTVSPLPHAGEGQGEGVDKKAQE